MSRLVIAHTPLPASQLLFRSMFGQEALSSLYQFTVELVSTDNRIDLKSLLSQPLSLEITQKGQPTRWLTGDIVEVSLKGSEEGSSRYYIYQAEVRPKLWYLSQGIDCRIFQEKNVPDIVLQVLKDFNIDISNRLSGHYRTWQYCVQYQESAFNFISRLMEHEGIYYYFEHSENGQRLVLADAPDVHNPIEGLPIIPYRGPGASALTDEFCVDNWQISDAVMPKLFSTDDYNFHKPYASLLEVKENPASYSSQRTEVYEWPGHYIDQSHAQTYTRIRQQEKESQQEQMKGSATTTSIAPGFKFTLIKAAREADNQEYLIAQVQYQLWDNSYASGEDASKGQRADFVVIPAHIQWRTPRYTAWPKTHGPQTARVVCPEGETIWTDKYGRVKVKFHWDRYGKGDDTSSCWVRVASAWAGQGYGGVQIPRLNDEVVIDFINGDADRPIIMGRVYNEANMPPWDLPAGATQMGFFSRTKGGHKGMANALRFEDKPGQEQLWLQAERDQLINVKNEEIHNVGSNRSKTVGGNETNHILQDRTDTVDGSETITIHGARTETVNGLEKITINNDREETVTGNETVTVQGNGVYTIQGNNELTIEGTESITVVQKRTETLKAGEKFDVIGSREVGITENETITIGGFKIQTITGNEKLTVGTRDKTVNGYEKVDIHGMQTKTAKGQTFTINGMQIINANQSHTLNVKGSEIRDVTGSILDKATSTITFKVGDVGIEIDSGSITLTAGGSTIVMDSGGVKINGSKIELNG